MKKATSKTKTKPASVSAAAAALAAQYTVVIARVDGAFRGYSVEMPLVFGGGSTETACAADIRFGLGLTIDGMLEAGERPPAPASRGRREVQMNVRLTPDERLRIEEKARQLGFRSASDYMRRAALRGVA